MTNQNINKGTVYWFTGLSGAGKTTIGQSFYKQLKEIKSNAIFLDGDILREIFANDLGHSVEERKKSAMRNARLCKALADQGIDIICATISMFHECQNWNREHINNYKEIYLKVPLEILIQRDNKEIYCRALNGELKDVVGIDILAEEPEYPDILIENDGKYSPEVIVEEILKQLSL